MVKQPIGLLVLTTTTNLISARNYTRRGEATEGRRILQSKLNLESSPAR